MDDEIGTLHEAIALLESATRDAETWTLRVDGANVYVECGDAGTWVAFYCGDDRSAAQRGAWIALMDPVVGRVLVDVFKGCVADAKDGADVHPDWVALAEVLVSKGTGLFSA